MNPNQNESKKTPAEEREERILKYWNERDIFRKSVDREPLHGDFVFYDGPPFATGLPHFGHVFLLQLKTQYRDTKQCAAIVCAAAGAGIAMACQWKI